MYFLPFTPNYSTRPVKRSAKCSAQAFQNIRSQHMPVVLRTRSCCQLATLRTIIVSHMRGELVCESWEVPRALLPRGLGVPSPKLSDDNKKGCLAGKACFRTVAFRAIMRWDKPRVRP